jgi:tetratricopeptide (TPR) repeat protein
MADDLRLVPTSAAAPAVAPPGVPRPEVARQTADAPVRPLDDTAADVVAGQQALARGAWEQGRDHFESALSREQAPAALEGLGVALMCLGEPDVVPLESWEKAYRLYLDQGDRRAAASVATTLGLEYEAGRGERAVGSGWLQRAHRLLDGLEPGPEHARLAVWEAHLALLFHNDTDRARERIAEAIDLGRSLGLADVEMQGLALEGVTLVREGKFVEGMQRLDEVTTAAVAGEFKDIIAAGNASCYLMTACEHVQDYDRVSQWFERVKTFFEQWRHRRALTFCRNHLVAVLLWRGNWKEAEDEIEAMRRESATTAPGYVGVGTVRLAELRRRQGRSEEAAALFAEVEAYPEALLGRAAMAIDVGDLETALDLIDRFFRRLPSGDKLGRAPGLELLVRVEAARGNREQTATALAELSALTEGAATDAMRATFRAASAVAADAAGDHETARRCFEDAVDLFDRTGAPFELGRARIGLAGCLKALGRQAAAEQEARAALVCLEKIGATHEAARAAALLGETIGR